jgi:hypothetical protein
MGPGDDPVQNGRRIFNAKCIKVVTAMSTPLEPVLGLPATYGQERDAVLSEGEWETLVESIISTRVHALHRSRSRCAPITAWPRLSAPVG